jgi:hypothetical protein
MEKKYCSYELAYIAKKMGFDEDCFQVYENENKLRHLESEFNNSELVTEGRPNWITAPELTQLQQWVWERFKVWIISNEIPIVEILNGSVRTTGKTHFINVYSRDNAFDCPYKALQAGLIVFLTNKQ